MYTDDRNLSRSLASSSHLSVPTFKVFRLRLHTFLNRKVGRPRLRVPSANLLYNEFVDDTRKRGRPTLRFKDVCKRDLKNLNIGSYKWEELANDRDKWRFSIYKSLKEREKTIL